MDQDLTLYKDIFLNSPIPRLVATRQSDGHFVFQTLNNASVQYFGLHPDKTIDHNANEIFGPEIGELIDQAFQTCVLSKQTITVQSIAEMIGNPEVHAFIFNPLKDEKGDVAKIDMIARMNLPDNIQLRRERDDAISLLTSIFDTATVGIIVLDRHQRVIRVNDVFVSKFGWGKNDIIGQKFEQIVSPEDLKKFDEDPHERDISKQARELTIIRPDGSTVDVLSTTAYLEMSHNRRFKIATLLDISKQKDMEHHLIDAKEEAETANKAKSAFLANMSHELRTPLNAILGFSELIKNGTFGPVGNPKYAEYLNDIHFSASHLLDIINDVLDMSKIEAGKVEMHEENIDVHDLLSSMKRIMHDRIKHAGLELTTTIQKNLPGLYADRRWTLQMLMNLITNSAKFSAPGSKIMVEAGLLENGNLRMSVTDFGKGIEESKLQSVLEPFGQAGEPGTNMGQGTGLGLPLAKAMIEMHGGKLTLNSKFGKGTTVHLDFPIERCMVGDDHQQNNLSLKLQMKKVTIKEDETTDS